MREYSVGAKKKLNKEIVSGSSFKSSGGDHGIELKLVFEVICIYF